MKYFSLFSGIGGFELGIRQAYENNKIRPIQQKICRPNNSRDIEGGRRYSEPYCIGYSEIDKYAVQIYQNHFNHKNYGNVTKINPKELPNFDLLVGGFPCQAFSIAGKRRGFNDTRGTLFFEIVRIVREKQPRLLLLENVKGLLSHDKGQTFLTIITALDELGYDCQWQVLNSKNFGVPQNRERVFIVGHLRGTCRPEVFPLGESDTENIILPTITTRITADSNGTYMCKKQAPKQIIGGSQGNRVYDPSGISTTLASQAGGLGAKTGLYAMAWSKSHRTGKSEADKRRKNYGKIEERLKTGEFNTLNTGEGCRTQSSQNFVGNGLQIRRLTPTECERLQGFPDDWTEGVSDTQRYKCLGNAVTVNVIRAIIKKILNINQEHLKKAA
jgi:DNA (cytosine-5)-methyltransferase 1